MKKILLSLLLFPALMSAQFVAKKGFDTETRSTFVTVNVAPAAKFTPADAIVADKPVYLSLTVNRSKADGADYNAYSLNFRFDSLPDGTCLKSFEGKLNLVFDDGMEAQLMQSSSTDCGEHANIYVGSYSVYEMDIEQLKTGNLKKITLSTEKGPIDFMIKPEKSKTIKASIALLDATK
jgi:hypothetical protein